MTAKSTPLISIERNNNYRRFVGKSVTNHIISERPLIKLEVELFRRSPAAFIGLPEEPEAA